MNAKEIAKLALGCEWEDTESAARRVAEKAEELMAAHDTAPLAAEREALTDEHAARIYRGAAEWTNEWVEREPVEPTKQHSDAMFVHQVIARVEFARAALHPAASEPKHDRVAGYFAFPTVIDRSHPNQAYVTYGFCDEETCTRFIAATRRGNYPAAPEKTDGEAASEPNMRHPKIQSILSSRARYQIELSLIESLIDDPEYEYTPTDHDYTTRLTEKVEKFVRANRASEPKAPCTECGGSSTIRCRSKHCPQGEPKAPTAEKMVNRAREHGMDLGNNPVAYEFYNKETGHAIVDYTRWTHAGHLTDTAGYEARPLVYASEPKELTDEQISEIASNHYARYAEWHVDLYSFARAIPRAASPQVSEPRAEHRPTAEDAFAEFKNFHRALCERFDYVHDERDWKRDQISLIEWIAKKIEASEPKALTAEQREAIKKSVLLLEIFAGHDSGANLLLHFGKDWHNQAKGFADTFRALLRAASGGSDGQS